MTDVFDYLSEKERPPVTEAERGRVMVVTQRAANADEIEAMEREYIEQITHPDHVPIIFYDADGCTPIEPGAEELGILGGISREEYFALFTLTKKGKSK